MKVHIASHREIGQKCIIWAKENLPDGFELSSIDECNIFISVMYENLISEKFIESKTACFNFHPGILPEYRGAGSFSWAILNEDDFCGITLHKIDTGIDSGNIIEVRRFPIAKEYTAQTLYNIGMDTLYEMFVTWFPRLITGRYFSVPQNELTARTYYRKDLKRVMDVTKYARAFTFEGKDNAYYYDRLGKRHQLVY